MPPLTYIHAFETARTTAGGKVANGAADAMQKTCGTIGLFNAEGQNKPSAEPSSLELCRGADYIANIRADARKYAAFAFGETAHARQTASKLAVCSRFLRSVLALASEQVLGQAKRQSRATAFPAKRSRICAKE